MSATIDGTNGFKVNGTQLQVGPVFSATCTTTVTTSAATYAKIPLNTEQFDSASCFNNTGSTVNGVPAYAFLPNVPGYYQINVTNAQIVGGVSYVAVYKNGSMYNQFGASTCPNGSTLVYLNGTTDYVELWVYTTTAVISVTPTGNYVTMNGSFVRGT